MQLGSVVVADRFEIQQAVRKGGMSTVYRALDRKTNTPVALKLLAEAWRNESERFLREAMALERLHHPGVVRYVAHGSAREGTMHYLAMEWLEGEDLAARLERKPLTLGESVDLAARVCSALAAAHAAGLVHRDIKPSNLFLPEGKPERVKVIDFGIARFADRADLTGPGIIFGTAGYMAPEQARGERRIDPRADVFALGCVLFECIAGRPVFSGAHATAILAKVVLEDAPKLRSIRSDVPDALDRLVGRMLSKVPGSRPADARALASEIEELSRTQLDAPPPQSMRPESLTDHEQRLVSVVMTSGNDARATDQTIALRTLEETAGVGTFDAVRAAIEPFGAHLEYLRNGSLVAILTGRGNAADQAANAARCALSMRTAMLRDPRSRDMPIVVAMGRGILGARVPVGEAIDHAVEMLRDQHRPNRGAIRIDEMTAALLDVRFDVRRDSMHPAYVGPPTDYLLRGEREAVAESTRTLLGMPTPCVGRDRELGYLRVLYDEALTERVARAVLVTGQPGIGKSRLRHEFQRILRENERESRRPLGDLPAGDAAPISARTRGVEIWSTRGDPMSAGSPFAIIAQAVRRTVGVRDDEPIAIKREKLRVRVQRHVSPKRATRVMHFLGELIGARFPDEESLQLRAARQDPMLMGDQMRAAWEDFLDAESAAHPVVLMVEDLHWGDLPSVQFIDAALRNLRDRPFLVVALARPEVHDLFPSLWSSRGVHEITLGELTKKASEKLAREVLGDRASVETVARIVERAAGNAFYLEELIRAVAEGSGNELPDTVVAMVQARLERLEPDARRVLRAASVFGQVFWRGGVRALLGEGEDAAHLDEWIATLVEREVISRRAQGKFAGEQEYGFHQSLVREGAYAMLTDQDRKLGHMLAGDWLERAGEHDAMTLGEHFERGGEHGKAIGWYRRAVEHALEGNDFEGVIARAERGVACGASGEVLGALRLSQAEAHRWRGDLPGAEACSMDAMRLLPRCTPAWFSAVGELSLASGRRGKPGQLVVLGQMLHDLGKSRPVSGPHAVASARAATQLMLAGKAEVGGLLLQQIERVGREQEEQSPAVTARINVARFYGALFAGDIGAVAECAKEASARFEAVGDLRNACVQRGDLAYAQVELGAYAQAESNLREVLTLSQRLGRLHYASATAKQNLAFALARLGVVEEARVVASEAIADFQSKGDRRMEGASRIALAEVHIVAGDFTAAHAEAEKAARMLSIAPPLRAYALALQAQIELSLNETQKALVTAQQADEVLKQVVVEGGESLVRLVWAEALHANGRLDEARVALGVARDRLVERARKIGDPAVRRSFLERVPENARTLELARAWLDAPASA